MTLGEKIIELRKKKKLTQEQLAEKLGIIRQTLSNWENNTTSPDIVGKIIDFDDTWFMFDYYNKSLRKNITEYLKINDLKSMNEIKTNVK